MKKTFLAIACTMLASGAVILSSCAGNKTETETPETEVTEEVAVEEEAEVDADKLTADQKNALTESKLVTDADFNKTIFIDFNATWCGPCRQFAPFFEAAAEKYASEAKFIAVDTDEYPNVANAFGIQSIPTMIAVQPDGTMTIYNGTQELVGEGVFEAIVNKLK